MKSIEFKNVTESKMHFITQGIQYYKRSNAESTVQMVKSKFGDFVRSKTWTAQVNEVLCKIICHNICVNIQEMHELGIEPDFHMRNN